MTKIYIIKELIDNCAWEIVYAFKEKKQAEKELEILEKNKKTIQYPTYQIEKIELR